jgi:outer membrane protein TolC
VSAKARSNWPQGSSSTKPLDVALWWRRFRDPALNDLIAEALKKRLLDPAARDDQPI